MKTIIVNLFGGPGCGKSTGATYIFSKLKMEGIDCELVTEFAKDKVWEESTAVFENQAYIFGKQYFKTSRCAGKVAVIITDSPLLLSVYYNNSEILGEEFNTFVKKVVNSYTNFNYFINRVKPYNPNGRFQTEEDAKEIDKGIKTILLDNDFNYFMEVKGNEEGYNEIISDVLEYFK